MLFVIIGAIIGSLEGVISWATDFVEVIMEAIVGAIIGALGGICIYILLGGVIGYFLPVTECVEEYELCSLNNDEATNYLFPEYDNPKMVYRYIVNIDDGKCMKETDTSNVYIHKGNYKPTVIVCTYKFAKDWYWLFAIDINSLNEKSYTEFFIPENTVIGEYNIDLQ